MALSRVGVGICCTVIAVKSRGYSRFKMHSFGLCPGARVTVRYRSKDGGVTVLEADGSLTAVETKTLRKIAVQPILPITD